LAANRKFYAVTTIEEPIRMDVGKKHHPTAL
jgi:hypothetical protein